jgi:hypothetical protein
MRLLLVALGWIYLFIVPVYLYAFTRFYRIVNAEKPEWVQRRGSLSFFYDGLPRQADPNVTVAVIRAAFSSRVSELRAPKAAFYVRLVRILLLVGLAIFALILYVVFRFKP